MNFCSFFQAQSIPLSSGSKYLCFHAENLPFLSLSSHELDEARPSAMMQGWYMIQASPACVVHLPGHRDYLREMVLSLKSGQPKPLLALVMEILGRLR